MTRGFLLAILLGLGAQVAAAQSIFVLKDVAPGAVESARAREAGLVDEVAVAIGDEIKPGQIVAKLDHERQLYAYETAKLRAENEGGLRIAEGDLMDKTANLAEMQGRLKRRQVSGAQVEQAAGQERVASGKLEQARMQAELARLEAEFAEKMLERRFIRSPIGGTVIEIARAVGARANEGDVVVTVANLAQLTAAIPMSPAMAASLPANASFPVRLAGSNTVRLGRVQSIAPRPGSEKGDQLVKIVFDNPDPGTAVAGKAFEVLLPEGITAISPARDAGKKSEPAKSPRQKG